MMKPLELLAPAKDLECGMAAIVCGADALYVGAPRFGARSQAGNSLDDIAQLIAFAHKYYAKVYITVNTILTNAEIVEAKELITTLYNMGGDGIIIQDYGLIEIGLPPIPLIASTQMHNDTLAKILFLQELGLKRVILARELGLVEMAEIARQTTIELECFIHGALCVCYSGQCYLSYAIGGRSGNRGECAQPCRKRYTLVDGQERPIAQDLHLLSLKDLSLASHLEELAQAGITSFKIEGRLKDIHYIRNVVSFYRRELDNLIARGLWRKASSGHVVTDLEPDLHKTFHRGYTTYFLQGRGPEITSPHSPTWMGEPVGKADKIGHDFLVLRPPAHQAVWLHPGDGICFMDVSGSVQGTQVNQVQGTKIFVQDITHLHPGAAIYRNLDHTFLKKLKNAAIQRVITVRLSVSQQDETLLIKAQDEDQNDVTVYDHHPWKRAKNPQKMIAQMQSNLGKAGGTEFEIATVDIQVPPADVKFIPCGHLNELRRQTLESLRQERRRRCPQESRSLTPGDCPYPAQELDFQANVFNDYAARFYRRHGVTSLAKAAETMTNMKGKKVMTTRLCLRYQFGFCPKADGQDVSQPLYLCDEMGKKYRLAFDCQRCVMEIFF